MAVELDEIDLLLLTELQADADRTNVELSRLVGLSPAATLNRVRRLKASGVIQVISARLDPAAVGFPLQMYVGATLGRHDPRATRLFEEPGPAQPQIIAADNVTGEMDYLLTVVAQERGRVAAGSGLARGHVAASGWLPTCGWRRSSRRPRLPLLPGGATAGRAGRSPGKATGASLRRGVRPGASGPGSIAG